LSATEFWYNTSLHSALGRSPFEALYACQPRLLGIPPPSAANGKLDEWLSERHHMTDLIRHHLVRAQTRMKKQADKRRSDRVFAVGDMVYVKLQPYVQLIVRPRANQKLSFKYFGPYKVLERVGSVAYRLQFPDHVAIHIVLHVSKLRLATGFKGPVSSQLPLDSVQYCVPLLVLASHRVDKY
jgi:hypothetical protein